MNPDNSHLTDLFHQLSDEELLSRYGSDALTESASALALEEIGRRGLDASIPVAEPETDEYAGDYAVVARYLDPTAAHLACSCLKVAGIPALVADAQLVQTNSLWTAALGGVRLLVPALFLAEANDVLAALNRGDLALPDDDDLPRQP